MNAHGYETQMASEQLKIFIEQKRKQGERNAAQKLINRIGGILQNYKFNSEKFLNIIYTALDKLGVDLNRNYYVFVVNPDDSYALGEFRDRSKIIDGRQSVEKRPIYLVNVPTRPDPSIITGDEPALINELQENIEDMDDDQYYKFILESTIEGIFDEDFETDYARDLLSAIVRVEGRRLPYRIELIEMNAQKFKIRVSQSGLMPYDSPFIYHDSPNIVSSILQYIDYVRNQI